MNKKFSISVFVLGLVILAFLVLSSQKAKLSPSQPVSPTPAVSNTEVSIPEEYNVKVSVDFGNGKIVNDEMLLKKPSTAYDALLALAETKDLEVETKQYDFGVFVESINKVKSGKEKSWIYFVNGNSGAVAADKQEIKGDDTVEWKYLAPSDNAL